MISFPWIKPQGVFVLAPAVLSSKWQGTEVREGPSHHELAVTTAVAEKKTIENYEVILFGEEPAQMTYIPIRNCASGLFVRWISAESDATIFERLKSLPTNNWSPNFKITLKHEHHLFPSTQRSHERSIGNFLPIVFEPGEYEMTSQDFRPDKSHYLRIQRLIFSQPIS